MNKSELIQFLRENEIWAKRTMGQNFLLDDNVLRKIIAAAELKSSDTVVEIGPGLGILTEELAKHAGKVIAIEKDDKLARALNNKIRPVSPPASRGGMSNDEQMSKIQIINQDALDFEAESLQLAADSYKVVANIPYNITSAVIRKFLEAENKPQLLVLMVQKEVAQRICAKPGEMSLLSISVQFYAEPEIVSIVKNTSFFPVPKVDSAIIKLKVKSNILNTRNFVRPHQISRRSFLLSAFGERESACDRRNLAKARNFAIQDFFRLVKFGFASKRKTLENNLAAGFHINKTAASDIIKKAGLPKRIRAQELSVGNWIKLAERFYGKKSEKVNRRNRS